MTECSSRSTKPQKIRADNMYQKTREGIWKERCGWVDFTLSKTALILASVIIISAMYHLEADLGNLNTEIELNAIALDFKSAINDVGNEGFEIAPIRTYSFDLTRKNIDKTDLDVYISGEYVRIETETDERTFYAVKPLTFRTLTFDEKTLRNELANRFEHNGSKKNPIISNPTEVIDFLSSKGTQEVLLDKEKEIHIQKTSVYVNTNDGVNKLDCVLVYQ